MAKPSSKQQEALQLLDDLDNLSGPEITKDKDIGQISKEHSGQAADVLAFIDEVTLRSSEPARSTPSRLTISRPSSRASNPPSLKKKGIEASRSLTSSPVPVPTPAPESDKKVDPFSTSVAPSSSPSLAARSGWDWGSVWSSTTAALQQARSVVDDQVKTLSTNEQARKLQEGVIGYVKTARLEKIGKDLRDRSFSAFNEILNAVAPPISEHEVLRVSLSHDMQGYDGVESIIYQALAKVMEQVDGGELIVNRGNEAKMKNEGNGKKDMNLVEGLDTAKKLAKAAIDDLVKNTSSSVELPDKSSKNPTTTTGLFMRLQPFTTKAISSASDDQTQPGIEHVQFYILLYEPFHDLIHHTMAQAVPRAWVETWDSNEWVEDLIVESLRLATEVVGQEYILSRMGPSAKTTKANSNNLVLHESSSKP